MIVRDVTGLLTTPEIRLENTVDGLLSGTPDQEVTGVATAFLATQEVIEKAVNLGVNLIISHEGIFYRHRGTDETLEGSGVYLKKRRTIEENRLAIFRYHDYIHRRVPDGITEGLLHSLQWDEYEVKKLEIASILELPETELGGVIAHIKKCLGVRSVRAAGDPALRCQRVGLLVGYRGAGENAIDLFEKEGLDTIIYGEGPEWETPEYVRDAVRQGAKKALIVLGHGESEAPGMRLLADSLQKRLPGVAVHFIPQDPVLEIV